MLKKKPVLIFAVIFIIILAIVSAILVSHYIALNVEISIKKSEKISEDIKNITFAISINNKCHFDLVISKIAFDTYYFDSDKQVKLLPFQVYCVIDGEKDQKFLRSKKRSTVVVESSFNSDSKDVSYGTLSFELGRSVFSTKIKQKIEDIQ